MDLQEAKSRVAEALVESIFRRARYQVKPFRSELLPLRFGREDYSPDLRVTRRIEDAARDRGVALHLPVDHVVADRMEATAAPAILAVDDPAIGERLGLDIGPRTATKYADVIRRARTIVWNGPMGVFEIESFAAGTLTVARAVAASNARSVIGGGDSIAAAAQAGVTDRITHVSTGGGASLEFLGGRILPGVAALPDA